LNRKFLYADNAHELRGDYVCDGFFALEFDESTIKGLMIHGLGEFPADQFDTTLFYPRPDTEFDFCDD
jgi:hypothetical protein